MVGGMMLFHGIHKIIHGIAPVKAMLKAHAMPEILAYGVYVGEVLAPVFLIIGWRSRVWAGIVAVNMGFVLWLAHMGSLLKLGAFGAWAIELPMFYLLTAIAIMMLGSGKYAIMRD